MRRVGGLLFREERAIFEMDGAYTVMMFMMTGLYVCSCGVRKPPFPMKKGVQVENTGI